MKQKSSKLRRIGLGTTGLADMLAILGHKYGSSKGNGFIDKLFKFISKQAYEASVILAVEKGSFELFDYKKHLESGFMKRMPKKIRALVSEHGIRNCALLTQAPTGTVSLLSGNCSSGVEPIFAPAYERRWFVGKERYSELILHPLLEKFLKEGKDVSHFVGSGDLTISEHMEVQKIVQRHIDNAVSKTINMPEHYPIEEMSKVWLEYLPNLKGTTFYRENSRKYIEPTGVEHEPPLKAIPLEEALERKKTEKYGIEVGDVVDCATGICEIK
jgi:ribonucleoside-diphosphate reductase alpha chain